jgi:hypothetical protein
MKIEFSEAQLLERRRTLAGLEPLRTDCTIECVDGIDVDTLLKQQLRQWYLDLLDKGDLRQLALQDVASQLTLLCRSDGGADITLPETCRRLIAIRMGTWLHEAEVVKAADAKRRLAMVGNSYCRPGVNTPLAVDFGGGRITVYPAEPGMNIVTATAAVDAGPGKYIFDESALASLADLPLTLN